MNKRVLKKQAVIRQQLHEAIEKKANNRFDLNIDETEYAEEAGTPALTSYKPVSATSQVILSGATAAARVYKVPVAAGQESNGMGAIDPYQAKRPESTSLTMLLSETIEPQYAAWGDGATICNWGFDASNPPLVDINDADRQPGDPWGNGYNDVVINHGVGSEHPNSINVAMADGSARTIDDDIEHPAWSAFITHAGRDNSFASSYIAEQQ